MNRDEIKEIGPDGISPKPCGSTSRHRTNPGPRFRQTAALDSDGRRYRKPEGRIIFWVILEGVRQPAEGRGKQEDTMRAVTVYRLDDSSNFSFHTRHPIGSVIELRIYERVNNYKDL